MSEVLEVIKWYERKLKRRLTEAEGASVRVQYAVNSVETKSKMDSEESVICLGGLKHKQV